jgi:hypothetical protein
MQMRNAAEGIIRSWNAHEVARGAKAVIDYDCAPTTGEITFAESRLQVHERLTRLHAASVAAGNRTLAETLRAHLAYVSALLGERLPLTDYVQATQGCPTAGWPDDHLNEVGKRARAALGALGVAWGPDTDNALAQIEHPVTVQEAAERITDIAAEFEPAVRDLTGTTCSYSVTVEVVHVDEYWSYWLDGAGSQVRLRFNTRNAVLTEVRLRQFALHELLGHALQCASYADACASGDTDWLRLLSVHLPHQVMLEGLAQALPLFVAPDDAALVARVRLNHYQQLIRAQLHRAINEGTPIADCVDYARARCPFWTSSSIADTLTDRSTDPLLRSYLWSYPAGVDWFVSLADDATPETARKILHAAYERPLTAADLTQLWPAGPRIGGPGAPVRLRNPAVHRRRFRAHRP